MFYEVEVNTIKTDNILRLEMQFIVSCLRVHLSEGLTLTLTQLEPHTSEPSDN